MFIGVGLQLKDKVVDKILAKSGFGKAHVYYSPISAWFVMIIMLLCTTGGVIFYFASWKYSFLFIPYFIISYLIAAYCNTCFAIHEDKFLVINGNFPFRRLQIFERDTIKLIIMDKMKKYWFIGFAVFGNNYIIVETFKKKYKYYCFGLELDAYDENWTERTIDDLAYHLKNSNYPTRFKLQYE